MKFNFVAVKISIPFGAIKSEYQPDRFVTFDAISIPFGAIKSGELPPRLLIKLKISIPFGAIKRTNENNI